MISAIAISTTERVLENGALNAATPRAAAVGEVDLVGADAEDARPPTQARAPPSTLGW